MRLPTVDVSFRATGKSQAIDGVECHEHLFTLTLNLAGMGGATEVPPEVAAMMNDVKIAMNGSVWLAKDAPGAAEFTAVQQGGTRVAVAAGRFRDD